MNSNSKPMEQFKYSSSSLAEPDDNYCVLLFNLAQSYFCIKENAAYLKKNLLWMKTMHYPNTIRSHLVTIVPMAPFTPKSTSKLRSALHTRYSKVIPCFISRANTAQS